MLLLYFLMLDCLTALEVSGCEDKNVGTIKTQLNILEIFWFQAKSDIAGLDNNFTHYHFVKRFILCV